MKREFKRGDVVIFRFTTLDHPRNTSSTGLSTFNPLCWGIVAESKRSPDYGNIVTVRWAKRDLSYLRAEDCLTKIVALEWEKEMLGLRL
jgi:hypothetical protein